MKTSWNIEIKNQQLRRGTHARQKKEVERSDGKYEKYFRISN